MSKIVKVDIIDTDWDLDNPRIMDTYYLIDPDKEKLSFLQDQLDNRFENADWVGYEYIEGYIKDNFKTIDIEQIEIEY